MRKFHKSNNFFVQRVCDLATEMFLLCLSVFGNVAMLKSAVYKICFFLGKRRETSTVARAVEIYDFSSATLSNFTKLLGFE